MTPSVDTVCFVSLPAYGYFVTESDIAPGGAERQLYLLSQELRSGFDVHFVVGDYGQPRTVDCDGVTLHRAYTPSKDPVWRQTAALLRAMRRADADLYVYRGYPRKAAVTYGMSRVLGKRWVYNLANDANVDTQPDELSKPMTLLFEQALRDADGVIAQTPYQRDVLKQRYDVSASVVPNGYPPAEGTEPYDSRDYALWVGRIDREQKRPHLFLDLAEQLPAVDFRIAGPREGDDPYHRQITERAAELDNVTDLGGVDPGAIHEQYRNATVLVNTSRYEGFPNTFLEAWRFGTPTVGLDVDPGRYLDVEPTGYAGGDFEVLSDFVRRFTTSPEDCRRAGTAAREYFETHYEITAVSERYASVLRQALD